jgi:rod shape-determining protein MreC
VFKVKKRIIYFLSACALLFLLSASVLSSREVFSDSLKMPLSIFSAVRREISAFIFFHRNSIENQRLKKETGLLRLKLNDLAEIRLENERLKSLLSFKEKSSYRVIPAKVIGRSPDDWASVIIINKGSHQGLRAGMAVIGYSGLLGQITEVNRSTGKITLINDSQLCVSGMVQRSRQDGLVCGTLGDNLLMRYLSEESDIKKGDLIVTSGLTRSYPKGLSIGTVIDINTEFSGLSRYALIKPEVELSGIEEVLVVVE